MLKDEVLSNASLRFILVLEALQISRATVRMSPQLLLTASGLLSSSNTVVVAHLQATEFYIHMPFFVHLFIDNKRSAGLTEFRLALVPASMLANVRNQ